MSLNKTLDRLFAEIRRETRRNPAFADRIDAVLKAHETRRDGPTLDALSDEADLDASAHPVNGSAVNGSHVEAPAEDQKSEAAADALKINPVGMIQREGEEALAAALAPFDASALRLLVREHNLDPSGDAGSLERDALAAHIVAHAKRRVERDRKLFDY